MPHPVHLSSSIVSIIKTHSMHQRALRQLNSNYPNDISVLANSRRSDAYRASVLKAGSLPGARRPANLGKPRLSGLNCTFESLGRARDVGVGV